MDRHLASPCTMVRVAQSSGGALLPSMSTSLGAAAELRHRLRHGPQRGVEDVVGVDAVDVGDADADAGDGQDRLVEAPARLGVERLGVGDAVGDAGRVEHDGGCHHRPGQRPAAGLVDAGDRPAVQLELDRFQLEGRLHARELLSLFGRASRDRRRLSKQGQLAAFGDRALEQVGAQLRVALVEA